MIALLVLLLMPAAIEHKDPAPPPARVEEPAKPGEPALLRIQRIYVDRLTGGVTAAQLRDLIIAALQGVKLFTITENEERADAILRGAAEDLVYTDKFSSSESLGAHTNTGTGSTNSNKTTTGKSSKYGGISLSDNESTHIEERKHEAMATVRLVNKEGDVIWSTTQESLGAKFRGASADVAEKIARQLAGDVERARRTHSLP